jgi:hypothetical protein
VNRILASANEILLTLNLRRQAANMSLDEFNKKREAAIEELNRIRQRTRGDMEDVEAKKAAATEQALEVLKGLDERIKAAVRDAISNVELTDDEVAKGKPAAEKIQSVVNVEIRRVSEEETERVAAQVNKLVAEASDQLQNLTTDLEQTIKKIVLNFGTGAGVRGEQVGVAALGAAGLFLGGFGVVGGIVSGYRQAGLTGALTGGAASFGAFYIAGTIAAVIGLPFTLPVMLGAGLVGFFAGDKVTKLVFKGGRAKNLKEKAIEQTLKQIDDMHLEADMARSTRSYVQETFDRLGKAVSGDVGAVIDNTQRTLDDLARQKERQTVLNEAELRELDQIEQRTKAMQESAAAVNKVLTARAAGAAV